MAGKSFKESESLLKKVLMGNLLAISEQTS
jgi:hypothetical protein